MRKWVRLSTTSNKRSVSGQSLYLSTSDWNEKLKAVQYHADRSWLKCHLLREGFPGVSIKMPTPPTEINSSYPSCVFFSLLSIYHNCNKQYMSLTSLFYSLSFPLEPELQQGWKFCLSCLALYPQCLEHRVKGRRCSVDKYGMSGWQNEL